MASTLAVFWLWASGSQAQHVHVNAGAAHTTPGAPLYFQNGFVYDASAAYNVYLSFTNAGTFSGLHQGAGVSFTALASTPENGGPAPGHAADGAFLQLRFVSMAGPPGGVFGVWTRDEGDPSVSSPLFTVPVGTDAGTNLMALSESDGSPGADPYGHVHGRTFTATEPGLYTLGCRIVDTSTHGEGGGPIHTPSLLYYFHFQAGLTISSWSMNSNSFALTFGTAAGRTYYVESASDLEVRNWTTFAGPFIGNNHLQTAVTNSVTPNLLFRVRSD